MEFLNKFNPLTAEYRKKEPLSIKAIKELLPMQLGDVPDTHANVQDLIEQFDYKPTTKIQDGIQRFVDWYRNYYKV